MDTRLFAPPDYWMASQAARRAVVNGCGTSGWKGALVPDTCWGLSLTPACNIHDWMYHFGQNIEDKDKADRVFRNNMMRLIEAGTRWRWLARLRRRRAITYYLAVHYAGGPAFWANKNRAVGSYQTTEGSEAWASR